MPPQAHARGGRRALDRLWLDYLQRTADTGTGADLAGLEGFARAVHEFNAGRFFECHETWEAVWREAPYPERLFLLGLTKLAVALAHAGRGNAAGARRLLADGLRCLDSFPGAYAGVDLEGLRLGIRSWERGHRPEPPRIQLTGV